jgi:hypothetical protein
MPRRRRSATISPREATARGRKAFRLYEAVTAGIDRTPGFPVTEENIHELCTADSVAPFRRTYEQDAGVAEASETTWATVEGLLVEHYFPRQPARSHRE